MLLRAGFYTPLIYGQESFLAIQAIYGKTL